MWGVLGVTLLVPRTAPVRSGGPPPFDSWLVALIEEAVDRGFERRFVEQALTGIRPLDVVVKLDRAQAQAPSSLDAYLAERVTADLISRGREQMDRHRRVLEQIERTFGVQAEFLVAIWGAETGYGSFTGNVPVLQALATLAWEPRRSAYFRSELFRALTILREGHIRQQMMTGSWAGAMGQPQFMPSSYLEYAVDFDGDGRRDIWTSAADTLASIAAYLRRFGWQAGIGWGNEIAAPAAQATGDLGVTTRTRGCGAIRALTEPRPLDEWRAQGLGSVAVDGARQDLPVSLLTLDTRAFLVTRNYEAVLAYNCSHRYALSVAFLADRLR